MGEVIARLFPKQPPRSYDPDSAVIDVVYLIENEPRVEQARLLIEEANAFLFGEDGTKPDHAKLDSERDAISAHSLEEICSMIIELDRTDWRKRMEFIGAITFEYQSRLDQCSHYVKEHSGAEA